MAAQSQQAVSTATGPTTAAQAAQAQGNHLIILTTS